MNTLTRNFLILTLGLVLGISLSVGHGVLADREVPSDAALPLDELRVFTDVFARIKNDYVESVDDRALLEHAIRGMLGGLDPHSAFLNPDEYKELQVGTSGQFGGLGIEVGMEDGFVKVIAPIDDTPAHRAGVKAGDLIIRLDDTAVKGMTLGEAVKVMRGKPGTDIRLTIVREGAEKPLKITITRDIIRVKSVKSRILEDGFGYVRITQFQSKTAENLVEAVDAMKGESGGELKGLVLDLRNNPGGVLNGAVAVSDAFLEKGLIVYTEGRVNDARLRFNATPGDVVEGAPLVVLVNGGSASASEIVAGALQDQQRGVVIGEKTFGKGSVQTILPMRNDSAIKLTTALYYTPSGRSIQAEGILPDIELTTMRVADAEGTAGERIKEADLSRHLSNGDPKKSNEEQAEDDEAGQKPVATELAKTDYPLYEALNLLKGMYILGRRTTP